jgi:triphosphoribosyl-dephospho-CoA synthase
MLIELACRKADRPGRESRSRQVRNAAVRALYQELCLYPKPGLVSLADNGSHADMTAQHFVKSLFSLRHYFSSVYHAGARNASFGELQQLGIAAEARMMKSTGGVNTHRGAIFNLGILCAAVGKLDADPRVGSLQDIVTSTWAAAIRREDSWTDGVSNGGRACRRYAVGGARGEAAAGFPHVFQIGLPAMASVRQAGGGIPQASAQAFFAIMASLDDTNLLHRAGPVGLCIAKDAAAAFTAAGGALASDWRDRALSIHRRFVAGNLSPGGVADLLAATLFVDHIIEMGH